MDTSKIKLKFIQETLTCAICKEHYRTPVMINQCSHNFCSICIRRYFTIKQECPICGVDASTMNLSPNRIVETLLQYFSELSSSILEEISNTNETGHKMTKTQVQDKKLVDPNTTSSNVMKPETSLKQISTTLEVPVTNDPCHDDSINVEHTPEFSLGLKEFCTQSLTFSPSCPSKYEEAEISSESHDMFSFQSTEEMTTETEIVLKESKISTSPPTLDLLEEIQQTKQTALISVATINSEQGLSTSAVFSGVNEETDCPVCGLSVATSSINSHLDECLARKEKKASLRPNTPKRMKRNNPPITKLVYNLLSLRDLQRKLKEIGLSTSGDKVQLKRRHKEFVAKYQAEQDKVEPRRISLLIVEFNREEANKKMPQNPKKTAYPFTPSEADRQEHMIKHHDQYKMLEDLARKSVLEVRLKSLSSIDTDVILSSKSEENTSEGIVDVEETKLDVIASESQSSVEKSEYLTPLGNSQSTDAQTMTNVGDISARKHHTLRSAIEADSQAEEIKKYFEASLSPNCSGSSFI